MRIKGPMSVRLLAWFGLVIVAAGCGPGAGVASASPSASTPATSAPTATEPLTPVPTQIAGVTCAPSDLRVTITNTGAAAGTVGGWLRFENTGMVACALSGFPTLVGISPDGTRTTARHTSELLDAPLITGAPLVTIEPGGSAFAAFAGGDTPVAASCPPSYVGLEVTPPGATTSTRLSSFMTGFGQDLPACVGIEVMPVIGEATAARTSLATLRP